MSAAGLSEKVVLGWGTPASGGALDSGISPAAGVTTGGSSGEIAPASGTPLSENNSWTLVRGHTESVHVK